MGMCCMAWVLMGTPGDSHWQMPVVGPIYFRTGCGCRNGEQSEMVGGQAELRTKWRWFQRSTESNLVQGFKTFLMRTLKLLNLLNFRGRNYSVKKFQNQT